MLRYISLLSLLCVVKLKKTTGYYLGKSINLDDKISNIPVEALAVGQNKIISLYNSIIIFCTGMVY